MASILSPTSFSACSHDSRCHLPLTSFIGVFSRCECSMMPCSRMDAPFAQCAPRLIGDSNTGSCRVQTPFSTVASTAQPTEQCVHTVRFVSTLTASPSLAASAGPITPYGSWLANAPAPAARPERFRNVRRSIVENLAPANLFRRGPEVGAASDLRVSSMGPPRSGWSRSSRARARFRDSPASHRASATAAGAGSCAASGWVATAAAPAPPAPSASRKRRRLGSGDLATCVGTDAGASRCDEWLMRTSKIDTA